MKNLKIIVIIGCSCILIGCTLPGCNEQTVQTSSAIPVENALLENAPVNPPPVKSMVGYESGEIDLEGMLTVDGVAETRDNETIETTDENKNAVLIKNKGNLIINNTSLHKSGDTTDPDESRLYALNSIFASISGSNSKITNSTLTSAAEGSAGVFSSGFESNISISDTAIHTSGNDSPGLSATQGGSIDADNIDLTTEGESSPCIHSSGTISAAFLNGLATLSECAVVDGKNSITLTDSHLSGAGQNGVVLYQKAGRDTEGGSSIFTAANSSLTTTSDGAMFYITNTNAEITLSNTPLLFSSGILLNAAGNTNGYGVEGANSANVILKAINQTLTGDITCDAISLVSLLLSENTTFTGMIDADNTGDVTISLDSSSTWNVTGDSYITAITGNRSSLSAIHSNAHTVYYDASNSLNDWLNKETISLSGGGILTPALTD